MRARLIESFELAPEVRHFVFEAEGVDRLHFIPGQFVSLSAPVRGKIITRAYSIASAPGNSARFDLCLNRVPGGGALSGWLFEMKPGDTVETKPPLGLFSLRQPPRDSLFVATGTGIAPFRSMLLAHLNDKSPAFTLLFGVRFQSHLMYRREFEDLARRFPQFRFWPTLSRPEPDWTGRTGHVQAHLEDALGGRRDVDVYLCGLKAMVDDVRRILKEMGFDRKQILYEKYD
jgi:CDP-4-dehydro-6-deoxyglucose reductase